MKNIYISLATLVIAISSVATSASPTMNDTVAPTPLPQTIFVREEGEQTLHPRALLASFRGADLATAPAQIPFVQDLMRTLPLAIAEIQRTNISRDGVAPISRELNAVAMRIMAALREQYRGEVAKNGRKVITLFVLPSLHHGEFWGGGASLPIGRGWTYVHLGPATQLQSLELLSSLEEEGRRQNLAYAAATPGSATPTPQIDILGVRIEAELLPARARLTSNLLLRPVPGVYPVGINSPEVRVDDLVVPVAATGRESAIVNVETTFDSEAEFPAARFSLGRLSGLSLTGPRYQIQLAPPAASIVYCPELLHLSGRLNDSAVPYDLGVLEGNRARFGFLGGTINARTGLIESLALRTDLRIGTWVCVHPDTVARRFEAEINLILENQTSSMQPGSSLARELILAVEAWQRAQDESTRPQ